MNWKEIDLLPEQCQGCGEDCGSCDYAGKRWYLSQEDKQRLVRISMEKAIERMRKKLQCIE